MTATRDNSAVLIVGGSRGFGHGLALALAGQGRQSIVMSRSEPVDQPAAMTWHRADVRDPDALADAIAGTGNAYQHVVYCASDPGAVQPAWAVDEAEMMAVLDVTFHGFVRTVRGTTAVLRDRPDASILLVGSQAARSTLQYLAVYSAAKAAAERYALCLSEELRPSGIRVNVLGIAAETALATEHRRHKERLRGRASQHPPLPPVSDNLEPALFLLRPEARHVTGQVIEACRP